MDPLSIAASCVGLVSAITTITRGIIQLTSELRDSKDDLTRVANELTSLQAILKHIGSRAEAAPDGVSVSEELQSQVMSIVTNCRSVIEEIGSTIEKCSARRRGTRSASWVLVRGDVNRLRSSLETHKMALNIALSLMESDFSKAIRNDTLHIRDGVVGLQSGIWHLQGNSKTMQAQNTEILNEMRRMKELLPTENVLNTRVLDAIQSLMDRLESELPLGLRENLGVTEEVTLEHLEIDDNQPWVDWVVDPNPPPCVPTSVSSNPKPLCTGGLRSPGLVVAIDYGATSTAVAFARSGANVPDEVCCLYYDGAGFRLQKRVPSAIAYSSENPNLGQDVWGFGVRSGMTSCKATKLLLDGDIQPFSYESTGHIPTGKTPKGVITDYFRFLRQHIYDQLSLQFGSDLLPHLLMQFCLTMPAVWSNTTKEHFKEAVAEAGLLRNSEDCVHVLTETEAATYAALEQVLVGSEQLNRSGDKIIICDCSERTVDVMAYGIRELRPSLKIEELGVGQGCRSGRSTLLKNFDKLMRRRFGDAYENLGPTRIGPESRFMLDFESFARDYSPTASKRKIEYLDLRMRLDPSSDLDVSEYYDAEDCEVLLHLPQDMKTLFDPVVNDITQLLSDQLEEMRYDEGESSEFLFLYGKFSEFVYVRQAVSAWCLERGIRLISRICNSQLEVAHGAVLYTLKNMAMVGRPPRSRRHLGFATSQRFNSSVHARYDVAKRRTWYNQWDSGRLYLTGFMTWIVNKGDAIYDSSEFDIHLHLYVKRIHQMGEILTQDRNLILYSCISDTPPDNIEDERVEVLSDVGFWLEKLDFSTLESKVVNKHQWFRVKVNIKLQFSDAVSKVRCLIEGREVGSISMRYRE